MPIAGAFGVVIVATVGVIDLVRHGEWRALVRSRLALPAIVAMGYFVRVITLLTVRPSAPTTAIRSSTTPPQTCSPMGAASPSH